LAVAAGAAVASPQLHLTYGYLRESAAYSLRSEFKPLFYSAHTLLEFITPAFFGTSSPFYRWASNDGGYFGMLAALLGLGWIIARPRDALGNPFLWIFIASLGFIYAVPPFAWVLQLPIVRSMFVTKFWATATFAGAMLGANGLDSYRRGGTGWRILVALLGAFFIAIAIAARWYFRAYIDAMGIAYFQDEVLIALMLSVLLSIAALRRRPGLAIVLVMAESYYYLGSYNTAAPVSLLFPRTPVIDFLSRNSEPFRIMGAGVLPANTAGVFGLEDVRGYDAMTPRRYFEYMASIDSSFPDLHLRLGSQVELGKGALSYRDAVERPTRYWGPAFTEYLKRVFYWNEQLIRVERPALLDLLNVKYYLVPHGAALPPGVKDYRLVYSQEVDAYENPNRLPRAFVVSQWEMVGDESAALDKIRSPEFDPRSTAILCCGSSTAKTPSSLEFRTAEILSRKPNEVVVRAAGPGVLVLGDSFFPGWSAPGFDLYQSDYLFRGVLLPEGPQTVTFVYRPFN